MHALTYSHKATPSVTCHATSAARSGKRVLILGGTGRVGSSTAISLKKNVPDIDLTLAGRQKAKYDDLDSRLLQKTQFLQLDIEDSPRLKACAPLTAEG